MKAWLEVLPILRSKKTRNVDRPINLFKVFRKVLICILFNDDGFRMIAWFGQILIKSLFKRLFIQSNKVV